MKELDTFYPNCHTLKLMTSHFINYSDYLCLTDENAEELNKIKILAKYIPNLHTLHFQNSFALSVLINNNFLTPEEEKDSLNYR
mmetsp:Transcript_22215/g.19739  ORF Transcript_22215/g.19739 Transcript_22215/m.19739 type:complete len:84 (+) Transcript_22215:316-567(+)